MKYSLNSRKIWKAEPDKFSEGSGYISPYIQTQVIILTLFISKCGTSIIVFPNWAISEKLIFRIVLATWPILSSIDPEYSILVYIIQ